MDSTTAFERFWINVVDRSLMASLVWSSVRYFVRNNEEKRIAVEISKGEFLWRGCSESDPGDKHIHNRLPAK